MQCAEVHEDLVAYLDGELSPEERERLESHLAGCPSCRREQALLSSSGDLLSALAEPPKSDSNIAGIVLKTVNEGDPWCSHIGRELVACLDGELEGPHARPILDHLEECESCAAVAAGLTRTWDALDQWTLPRFEVDLAERILGPRRQRRGRLLRFTAAAIAASLLLVAGLWLLSPATGDPVPNLELLRAMDVLDRPTLDLLDSEPELLELASELEWLETLSYEELALLNGNGG